MSRITPLTQAFLLVAVTFPCLNLFGQATENPNETRPLSPLRRLMDESLTWYEVRSAAAANPMSARVALRWANNTRGSEGGMTVLYLEDGIPHAVCSIYPWEQHLHHEFDSVSRSTLVCQTNGKDLWMPSAAGVEFQPIPDADVPGDSPATRLRQMKSLTSKFASTMLGWRSDKSDRETLRLLPQPLYRYETSSSGKRFDGAVFAFVQGTDPESLLFIEAVRSAGTEHWEYAFVRQTSGELEGRYQDSVVWHQDRFPASDQPRGIHFTHTVPLPAVVRESLK